MATGIVPNIGRPGIGAAVSAQRGNVTRDGAGTYYPGGGYIDGSLSRDPGNAANSVRSLRGGLLMGKVTATGFYAPSIIGVSQLAYTSGGLALTISADEAVELVRRMGASGTFTLKGAATAGGTLTSDTVTYSAVDTTTGIITISDIAANRIAGALVTPSDGSEIPITVIADMYPILIPEDSSDVNYPWILISGILDTDKIINYPTDTTLITFVQTSMSTLAGGKFVFSGKY